MKIKNTFGLLAAVAVVAAAGWSYQQSKQYDGMSELALANVEALATGESDIPSIPCEDGGPSCSYVVKDANGKYRNATTPGMKRKL